MLVAQDQYTILDEGSTWIHEKFLSDGQNPDKTFFDELQLRGDTLLNNLEFKKLYNFGYYMGALRESKGQLVYAAQNELDTILDFNLTVGDTVNLGDCPISPNSACEFMILTSIDSIDLLDGSNRKRLNFHGFNGGAFLLEEYDVSWIDGVGSTRGLIVDAYCGVLKSPVCWSKLNCFQNDGQLLYHSNANEIDACTIEALTDVDHVLDEDLIRIYPNPFSGDLNVRFEMASTALSWHFVVYNNLGHVIHESDPTKQFEQSIQSHTWPTGLYRIMILTNEGYFTESVIKY